MDAFGIEVNFFVYRLVGVVIVILQAFDLFVPYPVAQRHQSLQVEVVQDLPGEVHLDPFMKGVHSRDVGVDPYVVVLRLFRIIAGFTGLEGVGGIDPVGGLVLPPGEVSVHIERKGRRSVVISSFDGLDLLIPCFIRKFGRIPFVKISERTDLGEVTHIQEDIGMGAKIIVTPGFKCKSLFPEPVGL